jgi:hypothetical protein
MWTKQNIPDQTGKTVIVTGANVGIGFETGEMQPLSPGIFIYKHLTILYFFLFRLAMRARFSAKKLFLFD